MEIPGSDDTLGGRLRRVGVLSWSIIGILVLVAFVFRYVLYPVRGAFPPLAIAVVIVYLLNPIVTRLSRPRGLTRGWATLIVYLLFLGLVTAIVVNLGPLIGRQLGGLLDRLPEYMERAARTVNGFAADRGWSFRIDTGSDEIVRFVEEHRGAVIDFLGRVQALGASVFHIFLTFLLAMVLSFYVLVDLPKIRRGVVRLIPADRTDEVKALGDQIGRALGGFFRGQLLVALFVGIASAAGLSLVKLPFAVLVGMIAGIFNLVPLIGPFIGAVPAVLIGLLSGSPAKAGLAALVLLIVQQIDNHIVSPNVMGRTVKLHPITVMVALLAGGTVGGIVGMLLAVPSVATAKILAAFLWEHRHGVMARTSRAIE